jgi:signal peptidase I
MFKPRWKKEAIQLYKGAKKFLHYKRDLLEEDRIDEIESRRADLLATIKAGDRKKSKEASEQLRATCEDALPKAEPQGWFEENVEVIFVAFVIALGLRAYILQPFRIPTGSMQPTLNGIIGTPLPKDKWPSFPVRMVEWVLRGRSYVRVVNKRDRQVALRNNRADIRDYQFLHFFSRSAIYFTDGSKLRLPAPQNPMRNIGLLRAWDAARANGNVLPAGTVVCEGTVDAGDLVLVDKISYHFRRPKRGEVFVFDTRGIRGIQHQHKNMQGQDAGSHYIKRLCGVPGDTLSIKQPNLYVDGRIAKEFGIQRVARHEGPYSLNPGYQLASPANYNGTPYLAKPGSTLKLRADAPPGLREYAALGDNTGNSLDSRYWGRVKEYNVVGPALFVLWPVTQGHWGFIH